jgi:hypothetical protein
MAYEIRPSELPSVTQASLGRHGEGIRRGGACGPGLQRLPRQQATSCDISSSSRVPCRGTHGAGRWGLVWANYTGDTKRELLLPRPHRRLQPVHVVVHTAYQGSSGERHQAIPASVIGGDGMQAADVPHGPWWRIHFC